MKITIIIENENGEVKVLNEQVTTEKSRKDVSQYARFFDESCPNWTKDPGINLLFLRQQEAYANAKLKNDGYLFLNDVYAILGIPRSKEGQVVGWVYNWNDSVGDNFVDFGIYADRNKGFVNGFERSVLLDFNVDGSIIDKIN